MNDSEAELTRIREWRKNICEEHREVRRARIENDSEKISLVPVFTSFAGVVCLEHFQWS